MLQTSFAKNALANNSYKAFGIYKHKPAFGSTESGSVMNGLARLVACSLFLVVCSATALADTVTVSGYVNFDQTYATFSAPFSTGTNTSYFSAFSNGTVVYLPGTIPYMYTVLNGNQETFTITDPNGDVLAYYNQSNSPSQSHDASGNLLVTLDESGYYTINGGQQQAGFFDLTLNGTSATGAAGNVLFTGVGGLDISSPTIDVTPEPMSFLLLGTGMLGAALLLRNRSRRPALSRA